MADDKKTLLEKLSVPLTIKDVDFRIQSVSAKGYATILAYKDARVDMNRLDEVCGLNWQKDYKLIDGKLFCGIGIREKGEWIWRWDVGTESNTEKEKGQASDAFKRAGFNWGIGRELYDYPFIFLQLYPNEFKTKQSGQKTIGYATYELKLKKWTWDVEFEKDGTVKRLIGKDHNGATRFDSNKDFNGLPKGNEQTQAPAPAPQTEQKPQQQTTTKPKLKDATYKKAVASTKVDVLEQALTKYDLTPDQLQGISGRIAELKNPK